MTPQSILIIDQEQAVCDSLALVLGEEGFRCFISYNAIDAQEVLTSSDIDMVIVDSQLLDRNGLFSYLQCYYPAIKIILMSSYVEIEVTQKALIAGAHDFVMKPLDFNELIGKVNYYFPSVHR
ncbi:response regulator [Fodinibius sp. Rm-B-1B1-1]|uniref:response regulator n=1 Tax=Fodinibius alkaliphilus TaxID=3140241 RepID=UPI003159D488